MKIFSEIEIEQIILMAWGDTISFETIKRDYGLGYDDLVFFMKKHQSPQTYIRWRKRVTDKRTNYKSKHETISNISSRRQKFPI